MAVRNVSLLEVVLGLWLVASPFVFGFDGVTAAFLTSIILGGIIAVVGMVSALTRISGLPYANVALGVLVMLSPFVLVFSDTTAALVNSLIAGALIAVAALISELTYVAAVRGKEMPTELRRAA